MLGTMGELPESDQLLALAADRHELASLKPEGGVSNRHEDERLAVVPIVDAVGHLYGVLAVREMHFMAFQQPNLDSWRCWEAASATCWHVRKVLA